MLLNSGSGTLRTPLWKKWLRIVMLLVGLVAAGGVVALVYTHFFAPQGENRRLKPIQSAPQNKQPAKSAKMDVRDPLIWATKLDKIPRPQFVIDHPAHQSGASKRHDHHLLSQKAINDAVALLKRGCTFRIIVFAWKRRASLKRLTDSLLNAEYHGFTVHLDFHLDGGANSRVTEFIDKISWPHGRLRVNRHAERVGLERTIMESWQPVSDRELAFFFEDDIEASPRYFEYSLVALQKYILPDGRRAPRNAWNERLVGVSLNTPRYDEINMPARDWTPQQEIGESETQFLFQLPCSWGALYLPWQWREFLKYYQWRRDNTPEELHMSIPDSATMYWRRSWKKYLIEFMYMRGQFMLYPSLPRQLSFSTHHREPGEHTDAKPEEHLVDDLGTLVLDYFTVPLVREGDQDHYYRLIAEMKPLRELPLVSFHHERVTDIHALSQLGLFTVRLMIEAGWDHSKYLVNPSCVLDSITFPLGQVDHPEGRGEDPVKYLLYEPQASLAHQTNALRNAAAYAKVLNRTLIVPPIVAPNDPNVRVPLERIVQLDPAQLEGKDSFVRMIRLEEFAKSNHGWVERITQFVPWRQRGSDLMKNMRDDLITDMGLVPAQQAILYAFPIRQNEILASFSGCKDQVLSFRHLFGSFSSFNDETLEREFAEWARRTMRLSTPIAEFLQRVKKEMSGPGPLACVVYSKGDVPGQCGRDMQGAVGNKDEQKLIAFRSCQPTFERTLQYAIEDATELKLDLYGLYAINETIIPSEWGVQTQGSHKLRVFTRDDIRSLVREVKGVSDLPVQIQDGIIAIAEADICSDAAFFLGNIYSTYSNRTMARRPPQLPSNVLGFKVKASSTFAPFAPLTGTTSFTGNITSI